jgi:hypothetical protein
MIDRHLVGWGTYTRSLEEGGNQLIIKSHHITLEIIIRYLSGKIKSFTFHPVGAELVEN